MRAVNLIPLEERHVGTGVPSRSGGTVWVLIGGLGACLLLTGAWTLGARTSADRRAEIAQVRAQAAAADAEAGSLQRFVDLRAKRAQREQTVQQLASDRFDWSRAMRELARVAPKELVLTSLQGTVSPDTAGAGSGDTGSLRSGLPVPALELVGCTDSQDGVARALRSLRTMEGVTQVTLSSTERAEEQVAGASGSSESVSRASGEDCRDGSTRRPQFSAVVFFDPAAGRMAAGRPSAARVQEVGR